MDLLVPDTSSGAASRGIESGGRGHRGEITIELMECGRGKGCAPHLEVPVKLSSCPMTCCLLACVSDGADKDLRGTRVAKPQEVIILLVFFLNWCHASVSARSLPCFICIDQPLMPHVCAADGYDVDYLRVPVTDEKAPKDNDFEELIRRLWSVPDDAGVIFNCQVCGGNACASCLLLPPRHVLALAVT